MIVDPFHFWLEDNLIMIRMSTALLEEFQCKTMNYKKCCLKSGSIYHHIRLMETLQLRAIGQMQDMILNGVYEWYLITKLDVYNCYLYTLKLE